jgi:formylglycine-generating enzyme required for sulfatase activity
MRFIDMFMAALGSLVFLALLLVFLLPKTTQEGDNQLKKRLDDLIAENQQLRRQIPQTQALGANTDDKYILKRWFGVFLATKGCNDTDPEVYVRWEGEVINFETGKPAPKQPEFDASDVNHRNDTFVGHRYFDIGNGPEISLSTEPILKELESAGLYDLRKNALHTKAFYAVSRRDGFYSIYVGLRNPRAQHERECTIQPFYFSSLGLIPADKIAMTQQRPFAWLRHFKINMDGTTTFGTSPWYDESFKRDLAEFSNKQSKILCERTSLCGTMDAYYALLLSKPPIAKLFSPEAERALKPMDAFKECEKCPEMVVMPPGPFMMGSQENEEGRDQNEGPQHLVTVSSQFAGGRYAITFDEWDACVADGGCNGYRPSDDGWGRGRRPVINVSWDDAKVYVAWLSGKTGKMYRLPSEAEREYVTRAGTKTPFWWGSTISASQANYVAEEKFRSQTMPVDGFTPNPWGLFQVHGNVSEWTEDCYEPNYKNTPIDGSSQQTSNCTSHVLRGGSWDDGPSWLRSSSRGGTHADARQDTIGFRVARTLATPKSSNLLAGDGAVEFPAPAPEPPPPPAPSPEPTACAVTTDQVNFREAPNSGPIIRPLPPGTIVLVLNGFDNNWQHVALEREGWIFADYIRPAPCKGASQPPSPFPLFRTPGAG